VHGFQVDRAPRCALADIRSWHKADVQTALMDFRSQGNDGHDADTDAMSAHDPKRTRSAQQSLFYREPPLHRVCAARLGMCIGQHCLMLQTRVDGLSHRLSNTSGLGEMAPMTLQLSPTVEQIGAASTPGQVIQIFDKALDEIGAEYHAILLFPLPNERIDHGLISWKAPTEWRAFYSE
jgi:hypothetical protein